MIELYARQIFHEWVEGTLRVPKRHEAPRANRSRTHMLAATGSEPVGSTPEELGERIKRDFQELGKMKAGQ